MCAGAALQHCTELCSSTAFEIRSHRLSGLLSGNNPLHCTDTPDGTSYGVRALVPQGRRCGPRGTPNNKPPRRTVTYNNTGCTYTPRRTVPIVYARPPLTSGARRWAPVRDSQRKLTDVVLKLGATSSGSHSNEQCALHVYVEMRISTGILYSRVTGKVTFEPVPPGHNAR